MKPKLKRDWVGLKVRTLRELRNGQHWIPTGTIFTVESGHRKAFLVSEPCPACGVRVYITQVGWDAIEVVDQEPPKEEV